jgi:peptidoglycan L-alanyl-D-glutamate endopeptidase CwlK
MKNSRDLDDLLPEVASRARAFLAAAKAYGIDLLVTSTYRDHAAQDALYAQGRSTPGMRVTNARPGESWHNWRRALDAVPIRNGKPVWTTTGHDAALWARVGKLGEAAGLEWAGRWRGNLREMAHFQYTGGATLAELQAQHARTFA